MLIPDHETAVDFLNYEAVAKTVVALLKENREHSMTGRSASCSSMSAGCWSLRPFGRSIRSVTCRWTTIRAVGAAA